MLKEVQFPFILYATDYHEFKFHQTWMQYIFDDIKIKVEEVEFDESTNLYRAVVYKGRMPGKKTLKELYDTAASKYTRVVNHTNKQGGT